MVAIATRWQTPGGIIGREIKSFVAVGKALLTIRDSKLYREKFKTFKDYCTEKWNMSKTHANRLIAGSQVAVNLTPRGVLCTPCEIQPSSEYQIRPLTILEPAQQCEVWEEAVRSADGKVVTYKQVKDAVTKLIGPGPGPKTAVCFSLGIRLFRAPAANTFCHTGPLPLGAPFRGRGGAVEALSAVVLSFPGGV